MHLKSSMLSLFVGLLATLAIPQAYAVGEESAAETFGTLPMVTSPAISPDGKFIAAWIRNEAGYYDVAITSFDKLEFRILASLKESTDRIDYIAWANNDRLLISASVPRNQAGFNYRQSRLYSIDITGEEAPLLLQMRGLYDYGTQQYADDNNILSVLPDDPDHILLQLYGERDKYPGVFKVNVYTNEFERVLHNELQVYQWFTNHDGEVVLGIQRDEEDSRKFYFWYREDGEGEWKALKTYVAGSGESFKVVGLDKSGQYAYVISDYKIGREGLYKYDIQEGEYAELMFVPEHHDIDHVIEREGEIVGAAWYEHYLEQTYFDGAEAKRHTLIRNTFKGAEVSVASVDKARNRYVIYAVRDDMPGNFFLLDLKAATAAPWAPQYPQLQGVKLSKKLPFEFEARDGMRLNGYLSLPKESDKGKPPLVVMPHGGPQSRDYQYFDYWTQFLTHKGYAVLQVNFRGSKGFGSRYEVLGYKEWGKKMQDDVIDATKWVESLDMVDYDRKCIVGASYGGYVALMASVRTPELFDCYFSFAGIGDLLELISSEASFFDNADRLGVTVGNPENGDEVSDMRLNSPINFVENIQRPVLLVHGTKDASVRVSQSQDFARKAKIAGKDVEYVELKDATHHLGFGPNRIRVMSELGGFLDSNLR